MPAAPAPAPGMTTVYGGDRAYGGGGAHGGGADYEEEHAPPASSGVPDTYGSYPTYDTYGSIEPPQPPQPPQPLQPPPQQPQPPSRPHPHPLAADYSPLLDGEYSSGPPQPSYAEPFPYGDGATVAASLVHDSMAPDACGDGAVSPSVDVPDDWWRHTQPQGPAQPKSLLEQFVAGVPPDDAGPEYGRVGTRSGWKEGL